MIAEVPPQKMLAALNYGGDVTRYVMWEKTLQRMLNVFAKYWFFD